MVRSTSSLILITYQPGSFSGVEDALNCCRCKTLVYHPNHSPLRIRDFLVD